MAILIVAIRLIDVFRQVVLIVVMASPALQRPIVDYAVPESGKRSVLIKK
jgi:hypothetical protein